MVAVFLAIPFWRALVMWFMSIVACALIGVALAMIQRLVDGKLPTLDQFTIVPYFLQFAAVEWSFPLVLLLATGSRRLRGVAPITLAGLLAFGLAPLFGSRLTAWAATTEAGGQWLLSIGVNAGFFLLALPTGWFAWSRLKAVARAYESKRLSDAQLLARTWWLMFVASVAITLANVHEKPWQWLGIFFVSAAAYLIFPPLLAWTLGRLRINQRCPGANLVVAAGFWLSGANREVIRSHRRPLAAVGPGDDDRGAGRHRPHSGSGRLSSLPHGAVIERFHPVA
jgi:hypothetical protein